VEGDDFHCRLVDGSRQKSGGARAGDTLPGCHVHEVRLVLIPGEHWMKRTTKQTSAENERAISVSGVRFRSLTPRSSLKPFGKIITLRLHTVAPVVAIRLGRHARR